MEDLLLRVRAGAETILSVHLLCAALRVAKCRVCSQPDHDSYGLASRRTWRVGPAAHDEGKKIHVFLLEV